MAEEYGPEDIAYVLVEEWGYPQEIVEFLGVNGGLEAPAPGRSASRSAAKPIRISPIALSAEVAESGVPVNIQSEISGEQLGYVYSFIGRYLPNEDVLIIEDQDYIFSDENQTVGGITYPVWPQEGFWVDFDSEPTVYAISDGETLYAFSSSRRPTTNHPPTAWTPSIILSTAAPINMPDSSSRTGS